MAGIALIVLVTIGLAVLLSVLLPGAGLIVAALVVVLGIGAIVWLVLVGASGETPTETVAGAGEADLLGPGGADDPRS